MLELAELDIRAVDEADPPPSGGQHRRFQRPGARYQHRFCNTEFGELKFSAQELGIICELLLRGPRPQVSCARAPTGCAALTM